MEITRLLKLTPAETAKLSEAIDVLKEVGAAVGEKQAADAIEASTKDIIYMLSQWAQYIMRAPVYGAAETYQEG